MSKVKLTIPKGATFRFAFRWHDGNGNSFIPGATFRCHFRQTLESETVLLDLTSENGGFVTGTIDGQPCAYLVISDTQTANVLAMNAIFDVEGVLPNGEVTRIFEGSAKFTPEVTR